MTVNRYDVNDALTELASRFGVQFADDTMNDLTHLVSDVLDNRPAFRTMSLATVFYEKCLHCHLFIEPNPSYEDDEGLAQYIHNHRGDAMDEKLDETHEAEPSGRIANLLTWKTYGPLAMRERFTS